jgi:release factor glutamine methyltransferase
MRQSIAALLQAARQQIPAAEARLLLGHVLQQSAAWLESHRDDPVDAADAEKMSALAGRRAAGEPIAYLIGLREFYGRDFMVTPAVLIPRPETELLVDLAREKVGVTAGNPRGTGGVARILDLGSGSGCLAVTLALEIPGVQLTAVDISSAALAVARGNASRLGASVEFVESNWFAALVPARYDLIVANPPYVAAGDAHLVAGDLRYEPVDALTDHADGLSAIRTIIFSAADWLNPGAWLLIEHGYDQAEAVADLLATAGFVEVEQHRDLAGIIRVSGARVMLESPTK